MTATPVTARPRRPRHRRQPGHRPGLRPRASPTPGHRVAVTYRTDRRPTRPGILAVRVRRHRRRPGRRRLRRRSRTQLGPVEVLVSNAGITADVLVLRMSEDDFAGVLDANLTGAFRVAKRAVADDDAGPLGPDHLHRRRSSACIGQAGQANYAASKAGLVGLARSLAREFGLPRASPSTSSPPARSTPTCSPRSTDDAARRARRRRAPRPPRRPDEVAAAVRLPRLATTPAYITGAVLPVDGGLGMGV